MLSLLCRGPAFSRQVASPLSWGPSNGPQCLQVCDGLTSAAEPLCDKCRAAPQLAAGVLIARTGRLERQHAALVRICLHCGGGGGRNVRVRRMQSHDASKWRRRNPSAGRLTWPWLAIRVKVLLSSASSTAYHEYWVQHSSHIWHKQQPFWGAPQHCVE